MKQRVDYLVAELAKCQAALAPRVSHPGYLSAFPESFFDRVDNRKSVWAPWYTMHKILAGLIEADQDGRCAQAAVVLRELGGWVKFRVDRLPVEQFQASLQNEHGGMNEALANLSAAIGDPDLLRVAQAFNHQVVFGPLLQGEDRLDTLHANTQIPKIIGAAREYELTGNPDYRRVAEFFWQRVALHRSFVFGGDSDEEHFFPEGAEAEHLHETTAETCNTYNMLKLTRHVFAWSPSAETMDFYERALYNHILASQNADTGMMIYFMSLEPGFHKLYNTPERTFWCCTGTGMENHAKYGDTIYFHGDRSLFVNLFIPSELSWKEEGLTVRQSTRFPESDGTELEFGTSGPLRLAVNVRWPAWSETADFSINGDPVAVSGRPGSYVTLNREWRNGDRLTVRFALRIGVEALRGDPSQVAVLYGPIVLAGRLGTEGLPGRPTEFAGAWPFAHIGEAIPLVPGFVTTAAELPRHIRSAQGMSPLDFVTEGIGRPSEVTLAPLYKIRGERYNIYWQLYDSDGWKRHFALAEPREIARREAEARVVDQVWAGDAASENAHGLRAEKSRIEDGNDMISRSAAQGAFAWTLKNAPGQAMVLRVGYVGVASSEFDLSIGGSQLAAERIELKKTPRGKIPPQIRSYSIPAGMAGGKDSLEIRFTSRADSGTARVIFCELSRAPGSG